MEDVKIVYWSETGKTEAMANMVADDATKAELKSLGSAVMGLA